MNTCNKCQAIPRYSIVSAGMNLMPVLSCWPHLQRQIDELITDVYPSVEVRRYLS